MATNLLGQARAQFDQLVTHRPAGPLLGRAQLNRGWCFWEEGTNRLPDTLSAFREATLHLPASPDQAVARFKWADCQVRLADTPGAVSNYWIVATNASVAGATNALASQALAQIVRAEVDAGNLPGASTALNRLLTVDPTGQWADRSTLLVGQALARLGQPQSARALYDEFVHRFTNSTVLPEVRLALAKTFELEGGWPAAYAAYAAWLGTYSNTPAVSTNMIAQATFDLARVAYRTRPDTNALALLTNFVVQYPQDTNAPLAQYLVGEYAFGQGDYATAELHFQDRSLLQNTNLLWNELTYRARLMAGRAAVARQSYRSARDYFDWLITNGPLHVANSPIPVSVVVEAYLFRGDTFTLEATAGETNTLARFGEAINAFSKITERFPTNEFAPLAWGRIGECHFQLASVDPKRYESALNAFRRVLESPADASLRSQAEWKLGVVLEKQAQPKPAAERAALEDLALDYYLRVVYGKNLRPGEQPDPYWVKRAGLSAAELAETRKKWDVAIGLTRRLMTEIPTLRPRLEKKLEELQAARQTTETPP
jgi:outer membrane protein assembly factor BamD (BamD/ComL family)